ncbi:hypothetical protein AB0H77_22115 [Streptomyces sp. NPDC050844]|uniref:hypothetical protein n=1 Tax=Streptomyces sp. NPDC050844 TaxID=3155790 RepID=UPI00340A325A
MVAQDGLVEGDGQLEGGCHGREPGSVEFRVQGADAVVERGAAGVADEGGDGRVDRGGAQVEVCEELCGEVEFVVGLLGVEEGNGEGAQGLVVGRLAGFRVLLGLAPSGLVGGGRAGRFSLHPPQIAQNPLLAAFPAQGLGGGEGGGEVTGQSGGLGQSAPGGLGQAAAAGGDLLVAAA